MMKNKRHLVHKRRTQQSPLQEKQQVMGSNPITSVWVCSSVGRAAVKNKMRLEYADIV